MKRSIRFTVLSFVALILSCNLDGWGWLFSSDVDDRYADNQSLTAPTFAGPLSEPFSFVVIADTHVFPGNDTSSYFMDFINQLIPGPNGDRFVLVCGDLVQDGALADFQTYADEAADIESLGVTVYSVPGNHDLYNNGWPNYRAVLGPSMYTLAAGPVRIVAIDSANGTLGGPQRAWLEGVLASRAEPYCVTFTHMEFFSEGITETQQWTDINEAYSLMHLFETSGVNIHLTGHTHSYFVRTINGTTYLTVPSFAHGFVRVTVSGGVSWEVIYFS
ncbi:MAG: metallophosphoesterase [Spirochaetales bacterium]|nr:metallophosphoesterase [Spirochaetales bacterium]